MKKILFISWIAVASLSSSAQLKYTKWRGTIRGDNPRNVILDFRKDTVLLFTVSDEQLVESMTYTADNKTFTVNKIDGQSDCDNSTPGKYGFTMSGDRLFVKLISDQCSDRYTALDTTRWLRWKDHREVKLPEKMLSQFTGVYQFDPQHPVTITLEKGVLYIEGRNNGLPKSPLMPESETKFFLKIAGVEFDFIKDKKGKVIQFISHEEKDYTLKKIK